MSIFISIAAYCDPVLRFTLERARVAAARPQDLHFAVIDQSPQPVLHLYNDGKAGVPARPLHWDPAHEAGRGQSWWQLEQRSRARLAALLAGQPLGAYALGTARMMGDYARWCGIDYAARRLGPAAFEPRPPL